MVRFLGLSSFVAWATCVCARSSPQLDTLCEEELEEFSTLQLRGVLDVAATGPKTGMFGMEEHEDEEEDVEADDDEDDDNAGERPSRPSLAQKNTVEEAEDVLNFDDNEHFTTAADAAELEDMIDSEHNKESRRRRRRRSRRAGGY